MTTSYVERATARNRSILSSVTCSPSSAKRRREHVQPRCGVPRHATAELLRIELSTRDRELVERLLGLDTEHDRGITELDVEVDEQRSQAVVLRHARGEVHGDGRPAVPPLGEKTVQ